MTVTQFILQQLIFINNNSNNNKLLITHRALQLNDTWPKAVSHIVFLKSILAQNSGIKAEKYGMLNFYMQQEKQDFFFKFEFLKNVNNTKNKGFKYR